MKLPRHFLVFTLASTVLAGCTPKIPAEALQASPTTLADRQLQTRRFDANEPELLSASAQVLEDLGFTIEESETKLGVITAAKNRDATEAGQVAMAVAMTILVGAPTSVDKEQRIRASVVTEPTGPKQTKVRVTFQRTVWNTQGQTTKIEKLNDPKMYQGFFDKLSESVFLQAHSI